MNSAISHYKERSVVPVTEQRVRSAGNGCIMRLAPVVIASQAAGNSLQDTMHLCAVSGRETHFSRLAEEATALFGSMLYKATTADTKEEIFLVESINYINPELIRVIQQAGAKSIDSLKPTGYVIDTLEVAVWAFMTSENFKEGALKAVNLGGDSDTIGAVYGQLAGAYYGLENIPTEWRRQLFQYEEIVQLASQLSQVETFKLLKSRFDEDNNKNLLKHTIKENGTSDNSQPDKPLA